MTPLPSLDLTQLLPKALVSHQGLPPFADEAADEQCLVREMAKNLKRQLIGQCLVFHCQPKGVA
jgi:hypothetical protein